MHARHLVRCFPDAGVDDADVKPVDDGRRTKRDGALRTAAVAVFDRISDCFTGRDQDVLDLLRLDSRLVQPTPQGCTARRQVTDIGGEVDLEWSGLAVQQYGHIVEVAAGG